MEVVLMQIPRPQVKCGCRHVDVRGADADGDAVFVFEDEAVVCDDAVRLLEVDPSALRLRAGQAMRMRWVEEIAVSNRLAMVDAELKKLRSSGGAPSQGPSYAELQKELKKTQDLLAAEQKKTADQAYTLGELERQVKMLDRKISLATDRKKTAISELEKKNVEVQGLVSDGGGRSGQKRRKLEEESSTAAATSSHASPSSAVEEEEMGVEEMCCPRSQEALAREVRAQVDVLERAFSWRLADRAAARLATHALAELAKSEEAVSVIVEGGAVPALVKHLQEPPPLLVRDGSASGEDRPLEHEVENGSAFALGLLAMKPEHQQLINDAGALPLLVNLLKRHKKGYNYWAVNGVIRRAADAITNLARGNSNIKTYVRNEGGIPPLVQLLESIDMEVQRAAAGALSILASKNESNKNQIVECKALPTLILMLQSVDPSVHYEVKLTYIRWLILITS
ncbi:ARM REPEAT PROTEIN INTERACTING WITH ABF2-like [Zingiber officinale]|uniref:ARM REPEAT PROTEIN INTERACTING WITH ABF2-like n=1 Tax=Zingiber officinale TaxID=94328 RepID=UPI001C4CA6D7|nr:ARM REPEAT PROTEIN INTERACTING WITH ABF2-like [Zingiber officinale]